jgi:uncharacterized damage-inducible protein DinB
MEANEKEIAAILITLKECPVRIEAATKDVPAARLHVRADRKSWSINDILAHIRSSSDVWGGSIERMLAEEMPTLADVHPRKWIRQTDYLELKFHKSFQAYAAQRKKLLKILMKLSFDDWSRGAMIGGRIHTVFTQARRIAKHDSDHCKQIEGLLRK